MDVLDLVQADPDFYVPAHRHRDCHRALDPREVPAGWTSESSGIWTRRRPTGPVRIPGAGWKVHVSARLDRARTVLDTVAAVLFAQRVAFKHLRCECHFLLAHHKLAARHQSGKYCTAYPPDVVTARRVLEALHAELADEEGPSILTDRRYRDSSVVHYRYGAFVLHGRLRADGTREPVIRDGAGRERPDPRRSRFQPPSGVDDPFVGGDARTGRRSGAAGRRSGAAGRLVLNGYAVERAVSVTNAGATYIARAPATGRRVFVKEARWHNGLAGAGPDDAQTRLRGEHSVLRVLHHRARGTAPEPLDYFRLWRHEFLVTELVPGARLTAWMTAHNPIVEPAPAPDRLGEYHRRCTGLLAALTADLDRLHRAGFAHLDLNPDNVLVADDRPRLVDFEMAAPVDAPLAPVPPGAPGFTPPVTHPLAHRSNRSADAYGLSALALFLLAPLNANVQRSPAAIDHLRSVTDRAGPHPDRLWRAAIRLRHGAEPPAGFPGPGAVRADLPGSLRALRDGLVAGILTAAARRPADHPFPLGPAAYRTNGLCLAHGTAGVVHALRRAGTEPPAGVLDRLATRAATEDLPPGLHTGLAGVAWVLAEAGRVDAAERLLDTASRHPLLDDGSVGATLGYGRTGVALAHLSLATSGDAAHHIGLALALAAGIPHDRLPALAQARDYAAGLLTGVAGIALLDYYLARFTGDRRHLDRGLRLLRYEVDRGRRRGDALLMPAAGPGTPSMPYLATGSAGVAFVASRYLSEVWDPLESTCRHASLSIL